MRVQDPSDLFLSVIRVGPVENQAETCVTAQTSKRCRRPATVVSLHDKIVVADLREIGFRSFLWVQTSAFLPRVCSAIILPFLKK